MRLGADHPAGGRSVPADARSRAAPERQEHQGRQDPIGRLVDLIARPTATAVAVAALCAAAGALGQWVRRIRRDVEARKAELLRRDRILEAVGCGAERLLRLTNASRLNEFLLLLGEATGTSRAYIFENDRDEHGEMVASQRFEWVAPGVPSQIDNPRLQRAAYEAMGMGRWRVMLGRGRAVLGGVNEFPESEQALLEAQNIRSLVVLPIFIGPEWWGFIGFDETRRERRWSRAEVDALRTSAGLAAAAIERDRAEERIQQLERARAEHRAALSAERRSRFLTEASRTFGSTLLDEAIFRQVARFAVPALGDWCMIDVLEDDTIRSVAVAHADPGQARLADRIRRSTEPLDRSSPMAQVLESGRSRIIPRFTHAIAGVRVPGGDREARPRSAMIVPLRARSRVIGAMTLLAMDAGRFAPPDLDLAEELAGRASLALENAHLCESARRASRVRDEMLAVVSHDLRNPLHTISLSAGLLEKTEPVENAARRRQLEIVARSVQRAERLIDDLLDVARLEAGTFALETASVSSVDVAREALELHRSLASAGRERLAGELPDELPPVRADRDRLLQIFGNLLGNAVKFTPEGGRITLGAEPMDGAVRFRVTDTGPGIPADQLPYLFDPFWQAARKGGGTGLGLAIARGIVEAHGGRIRAESEPGMGTTISFTIPIAGPAERGGAEESSRDEAAD